MSRSRVQFPSHSGSASSIPSQTVTNNDMEDEEADGGHLQGERRPLLGGQHHARHPPKTPSPEPPMYSCTTNAHSHLPIYTNIHRIRRDIVSIVEDYLSIEQLRDVRINIAVVRPLVDKLYELDDVSIVYCLLVNRAEFLHEQSHLNNRQNVYFSRATLCELVATRILRRFGENTEGHEGLLLLSTILVAGFEPFQNAPEEVREEASAASNWTYNRTLPSLEIAILTESKYFLSSTPCQKVVDAIYTGRIVYTPSSYIDIIPDHYKHKPISLYDPRSGPLLDQYRLMVPRTRNILDVCSFMLLLALYLSVMAERNPGHFGRLEGCFAVYAFGWSLEQFATILEHGWRVYSQNLWSFLDVTFIAIYMIYVVLRVHGARVDDIVPKQQALDVLAMGAPVLVPRLAFNLLSDNIVFLSLRSMMADFFLLTVLSAWCFAGFLLSLLWLGEGAHPVVDIGKWMLWIWFGLDGTGFDKSVNFHYILGPVLMVAFAFLGNTLFLTILVSMLSNTFSKIVANATAEIQFRRAVLTLEGVKSDAVFSYQPPFNLLAVFLLLPLKFVVSPRWFHKIHVATVRFVNLPILLTIAVAERRILWPNSPEGSSGSVGSKLAHGSGKEPKGGLGALWRIKQWFWVNWRITAHRDIRAVFDLPPPESVEEDIAVDDELTHHLIRRQFTRQQTSESVLHPRRRELSRNPSAAGGAGATTPGGAGGGGRGDDKGGSVSGGKRTPSRRDSIFPGVAPRLRGSFTDTDEAHDVGARLQALEESQRRVEDMLMQLCGNVSEKSESNLGMGESSTLRDVSQEGSPGG